VRTAHPNSVLVANAHAATEPVKPSIFVATPVRDGVSIAFAQMLSTMASACAAAGIRRAWSTVHGCSFLPWARNQLAHSFLGSEFSHCFMVDADMAIDAETVLRMLNANVDYVSCAGVVRDPRTGDARQHRLAIHVLSTSPVINGLITTSSARVACTLLTRRVFERMIDAGEAPEITHSGSRLRDFFSPAIVDGVAMAEDEMFSLRAHRAGVEQWVLADATVSHSGMPSVNLAQCLASGTARFLDEEKA
jgi:hypothetical protein